MRDAHYRYANLEVSYPLSRMERAKGLTILATNRKEDLDGAFLRRLRYAVDFPLPGVAERRRIWDVAIPAEVDASGLDLGFLAERFPLTGGHIRSAVFTRACRAPRPAPSGPRCAWRTRSSPCAVSSTRPNARSASSASAHTPISCAGSTIRRARHERARADRPRRGPGAWVRGRRPRAGERAARGARGAAPAASGGGRVERVEAPPVRVASGVRLHREASAVAAAVADALAPGERR